MKFDIPFLACILSATVGGTSAFVTPSTRTLAKTASSSSNVILHADPEPIPSLPSSIPDPEPIPSEEPMFPLQLLMEQIQGGKTVRTYQMPHWAERVHYMLKTNGRPMKCMVQLWLGPERNTHTLEVDMMNGDETPYRGLLKFKKANQVLKISTKSDLEFPVLAGVSVPTEERSAELGKMTEQIWSETPKLLIQGGSTEGGGGSVRTFEVDPRWDAIQLMFWSNDVGKKSFRCAMEVLQGPNNKRQAYTLQCGGGSQPYHCVIETPGSGWMIRIKNKKFMEDGLFQFAIAEYKMNQLGSGYAPSTPKQWWQ